MQRIKDRLKGKNNVRQDSFWFSWTNSHSFACMRSHSSTVYIHLLYILYIYYRSCPIFLSTPSARCATRRARRSAKKWFSALNAKIQVRFSWTFLWNYCLILKCILCLLMLSVGTPSIASRVLAFIRILSLSLPSLFRSLFHAGHPSCLGLAAELVPVIKTYQWECMECKTCTICRDPNDEEHLMFCDECDRGYHTYCVHLPSIPKGVRVISVLTPYP